MISISRNNLKIAGIIWGISLIILVPVYLLVLKPQEDKKIKLENEVQALQDSIIKSGIVTSDSAIESLKQEVEDIKGQLDEFVVKTKDDIQNLASIEIYNISKELGLEGFHIDPWNGVEVAAFNDCKYVSGQTMIVGFGASYTEFAKFINMLERYKTVIFVDSFSITKSTDEKKKNQVQMNLAVLVEKNKSKGTKG